MKSCMVPRVVGAFVASLLLIAGNAEAVVNIETVPVGDSGNAPRPPVGQNGPLGGVPYRYQIGKYEVTNGQYR
ncbi:MAG: hypothetical protein ACREJC_11530, partial [Tepidisphaeraceae bacterium]